MHELTQICTLDELSDPGSFGFSLECADEQIEGFIVQRDGECFAYRNSCPHTGSALDWVEHQFLDLDGALIQCAVHEARFLMDTGECVSGPCLGENLEPLAIQIKDNIVYLLGPVHTS